MEAAQLDLLVFGAHPDDAEIGMGGTIVKHTAAGQRVGVCDLTLAEMSSNGTVERRQQEAALASQRLGLHMRSNLELPDRGLYGTKEQVDAITNVIRLHRPRVIFAPYWEDRHPDHIACSHLVQQAAFNAKLRNYMPEIEAAPMAKLYFYFINDLAEADLMVDISDFMTAKMEALRAYTSQFEQATAANGYVNTPLNQSYLERVEARDRLLGQKQMVAYAEGFCSKLPVLVDHF